MAGHEAFLAAIFDDPADDVPRLVYADWLDDRGDGARAEFIRVQVELARLEPQPANPLLVSGYPVPPPRWAYEWCRTAERLSEDPDTTARRRRLALRQEQLFQADGAAWVRPLAAWARKACVFERGFPASVAGKAYDFVRGGNALAAKVPLRHAELAGAKAYAAGLARCPGLGRLASLAFAEPATRYDGLGVAGARALATSAHLGGLRGLSLPRQYVRDEGLKVLLGALDPGRLVALDLSGNGLKREGVEALAVAASGGGLRVLDLSGNALPRRVVAALAGSGLLRNVTHLFLSGALRDPEGVWVLAGAGELPNLVYLGLSRTPLGPAGAAALARLDAPNLRALDVSDCGLGGDAVRALAESPLAANLTALALGTNGVTAAGAEALAASPLLGRLAWLNLNHNALAADGAFALAHAANLPNLVSLHVARNALGPDGLTHLLRSPHLPNLKRLEVGHESGGLGFDRWRPATLQALKARFPSVF